MVIEKDIKFYKEIFLIALPISLQTLLTLGINFVDNFMIGQLGEVSLAAVASANQFYSIFHYICLGLGNGCAVLTGQFFGAGRNKDIKCLVAYLYKLAVGVSLLFMGITIFGAQNIMGFYSKDNGITLLSAEYLYTLFPSYLMVSLSTVSCCWLRSVGITKVSMIGTGISFAVKVLLNYAFIFGNFGFEAMGIRGAALASIAARGVECFVLLAYILGVDKRVRFGLKDLSLHDKALVKLFTKKGQPVLYSDMMIALGQNAVLMIMGNISATLLAASSIVTTVIQIAAYALVDISGASATIVGHTTGMGDAEKAYSQGVTCMVIATVTALLNSAVIFFGRHRIVSLYKLTPEAQVLTTQLLTVISVIVIFSVVGITLSKGVLRGGGDTKYLMVVDVIFLWTISIPLGYFTGIVLGMPPWVAYLCIRFDEVIKCAVCIYRLFSKKWIARIS